MASNKEIADAFIQIGRRHANASLLNQWIPATFWAFLVSEELETETAIKPTKIKSALEKSLLLDRDLIGNQYGKISYIRSIKKKVPHRRQSIQKTSDGLKNQWFLSVETRGAKCASDIFFSQMREKDLSAHFAETYVLFANKATPAPGLMQNPPVNESLIQEEQRDPSSSSDRLLNIETSRETEEVPSRLVTPTAELLAPRTNVLNEDDNADVLALLSTIISPEQLTNPSLLKEGADMDAFRSQVKSIGVDLQKKANQQHLDILNNTEQKKQDDDLTSKISSKYTHFLDRFCCPMSKRMLQGFLLAALQIDTNDPDESIGILQLPKTNGGKGHGKRLIAVTPTDTPKTLNQAMKKWLPPLLEAVVGDKSTLSQYDVVFSLIKQVRQLNQKAFDDVCRTVIKFPKMKPHRQMAMFHKTNLNYQHGRRMIPYFNADGCNPLNSEKVIRKLEVQPGIAPTFTSFQEEGVQREAWCLPCNEVVTAEAKKNATNDGTIDNEVHVVLSADHGQRAMRVNTGSVFIKDGKVRAEVNHLTAHIDCRKDTTKVLEDSQVIAKVNEDLKKLEEESKTDPNFPANGIEKLGQGDMVWYSTALGKPNMASKHCWRCNKRESENQSDPLAKGKRWTLALLKEHLQKLRDKELDWNVAAQACGVRSEPLIDIEPYNLLFPPLHAIDLLGNTPFEYMQRWIWNRIKMIPFELILARDERTALGLQRDALNDHVLDLEQHLTAMEAELEELAPYCGAFDDTEHEADFLRQERVVLELTESIKKAQNLLDKKRSEFGNQNTKVNKLEQQNKVYGKQTQQAWLRVERMLRKEYNVHSSVYHGGKMEGNECRRLFRKATDAIPAIKPILLEFLSELEADDRERRADEAEIDLMLGAFQRMFQYFDLLSHYAYQPYGSLTDDDLEDATKTVHLAVELWLKLMPTVPMKVHAWVHFLEDLHRFRGMKSHNEQPMERSHQIGKSDNARLKCFRDFKKKTQNILRTHATQQHPEVKAMHEDTDEKKRKRHSKRVDDDVPLNERLEYIKSILELPPIAGPIPSILELSQLSMIAAPLSHCTLPDDNLDGQQVAS